MPVTADFTFVIDLDNTSADYNAGFQRALAAVGHRAAHLPPPRDYNFASAGWFEDFDEFWSLHTAAVAAGMLRDLEPLPGLDRALNEIADMGARIVVATYRTVEGHEDLCREHTHEWLARHVSAPIDAVHFTKHKHEVPGDLYIDDAPYVIEALAELGIDYLVMDAPNYNQHLVGPRVYSWDQVPVAVRARMDAKAIVAV